jgi:hypothetical protein
MKLFTLATRGGVIGALVLGLCVVSGPARADVGGGSDPSGYTAMVSIHFHGRGVPGGDLTRSVSVHPSCWWAVADGPATDAKAMLAWYDEVTGGATDNYTLSLYGPRSAWVDAVNREASGEHIIWYKAFCKNTDDYTKFGINGTDAGVGGGQEGGVTWITFLYKAFNAGAPIPAPRVDPEELARAAREVMTIPEPTTDHNPKVNAPGAPTLVGLPTWFWVRDPDAVGLRANGTRTIRAQLGAVWAQLVATTSGLKLSSPAGGTQCSPARSGTAYAKGVPESNGCTVSFDKASVGFTSGYPVTAATDWLPLWTGSDGTNGGFDQLTRSVITTVPVAEVQNIVTH